MADEIRVAPDATIADEPEAARAEIAMTRARMSETIDEIEDTLLRRKERLQDRLDVLAPVRERPLQAAGAVFGAGLLLGLLTGGDDDEHDHELDFEMSGSGYRDAERRAEIWETRARRLLSIAKDQRARAEGAAFLDDDWDGEWSVEYADVSHEEEGAISGLRDLIADRVAPVLGGVLRQLLQGNRHS